VLLLRIRQKPPVTVRGLGLSIVAVGWGAAALAIRNMAAAIAAKNCVCIVLSSIMSGNSKWGRSPFQAGPLDVNVLKIQNKIA
jgi:hypothetical protein